MVNYKEIFEELHELNRKYSLVIVDNVIIRNQEGGYYFDTTDLHKEYWCMSGSMPDDMLHDAIGSYEFEEIDKEGCWMLQFLVRYDKSPSYEDNSESYIVHTEAVFLCTLEEAAIQQKEFDEMVANPDNKDLFGNTF